VKYEDGNTCNKMEFEALLNRLQINLQSTTNFTRSNNFKCSIVLLF